MNIIDYGLYQIYKNLGVVGTSYDAQETEDEIIFTMGVPGLAREDIDIRIVNNRRLVIKSIKDARFTPKFNCAYVLPCEIAKKETYATVKEGILTVHIKKKENSEYRISLE
jgi:HSP20 family molecular chaperone IbpA